MTRKRSIFAMLFSILAISLTVGCNGSGGDGSSEDKAHVLSEEEVISTGGSSTEAVCELEKAASQAIMESGAAGGALTRKAGRSAALGGRLTGFAYEGSFSVSIDLDREVAQVDLWPNLTGQIRADVAGAVALNGQGGTLNADSVQIITETEVVYTDPQTGATVALAADQTIDFSFDLTWTYTDQLNWTVDVSGQLQATAFQASVQSADATGTVSIDADLETSATLDMSEGVISKEYQISGDWTLALISGNQEHIVEFSGEVGADVVEVSLDGRVIGAYSKEQLIELYQLAVETGASPSELMASEALAQTAQEADDAAAALKMLETYATQAIVDQSSQAQGAGNGPILDLLNNLNFKNSYDFEVDLDAQVQGEDLFPNATGVLSVQATGSLDLGAKTLTLDSVTVTVLTEVALTDPDNPGASAIIAQGDAIQYSLAITWSFTTLQTWTVNAEANIETTGFAVTLSEDDETMSASATMDLIVYTTVDSVSGVKTVSTEVSGTWQVDWTDGDDSNSVEIEIVSKDEIYLTVGKMEFGPLSTEELQETFQMILSASDA